ncbi:hypothetical protein HHK36_025889 [Tetracentron sinense]|uniref:Uncharacterized protein n=1 Tax=Tetracentron sinense TaxID=13715 RepID=A0A834YP23_TETSI|nr:hypothetical protein HHK36_025889 [Tetracentron sinense]
MMGGAVETSRGCSADGAVGLANNGGGTEDLMAVSSPAGGPKNLDTKLKIANEVQALYKLYNIQKSAMQEIRKIIYSQAQVSAFNSKTSEVGDGQLHGFVMEGKPLRPAYNTAQAHREESHALSVQPICALKEFMGCDSIWMNNTKVKTIPNAQNKPMRKIDLESPPEVYMDESEIQVEANSSEVADSNTILSERIPKAERSKSRHQKDPEQAKGSILPSSSSSSSSTQLCQSLEGNSMATTPQLKLEKQICNSSTDGSSLSTNSAICPQGLSTHESVQCDSMNLKDFCIKGSPSLEMNSISEKQNLDCWDLTSQTSVDNGNANPNCSGHGSNSIQFQGAKVCKDNNVSLHTKEEPTLGNDCCETSQMSHRMGEGVQSELEMPRLNNNGIKPSLSSILLEINTMYHCNCSDDSPETVASQEEPVAVTESNEDLEKESTMEEACESIAAKILLSFAPSRSSGNLKLQGFNT